MRAMQEDSPPVPSSLEEGWIKGWYITPTLDDVESRGLRNEARDAVWQLSSARAGMGVSQLLDDDTNTFWQSDGAVPHTVTIFFHRQVSLAELALHIDFARDESYSPEHLLVRAGTTVQDLEDVREVRLMEPSGWLRIPLGRKDGPGPGRYLRTWCLQISIQTMHQNGRDAHLRACQLLAPVPRSAEAQGAPTAMSGMPLILDGLARFGAHVR
jgi:anaphase-promoting complex subunit 10